MLPVFSYEEVHKQHERNEKEDGGYEAAHEDGVVEARRLEDGDVVHLSPYGAHRVPCKEL